MSAKKANAMRRDLSPALLQQFLGGDADNRLGAALKTPDIRLVTDEVPAEPTAPAPSPVAALQERAAEVVTPAPAAVAHAIPAPAIPAPIQPMVPPPAQPVAMEPVPAAAPIVTQEQAATVLESRPPDVSQPEPRVSEPVSDDAVSLATPASDERKSQQLYGRRGERAVDFNLSLTSDQADRLTDLAAYEMLRTRTKVSVSQIVRELIDFALHHVEDNRVIPTPDGRGLHKQPKGA